MTGDAPQTSKDPAVVKALRASAEKEGLDYRPPSADELFAPADNLGFAKELLRIANLMISTVATQAIPKADPDPLLAELESVVEEPESIITRVVKPKPRARVPRPRIEAKLKQSKAKLPPLRLEKP